MSDRAPIIRFPTQEEQENALDEIAREMRRAKERGNLFHWRSDDTLETITYYLKPGGGGVFVTSTAFGRGEQRACFRATRPVFFLHPPRNPSLHLIAQIPQFGCNTTETELRKTLQICG